MKQKVYLTTDDLNDMFRTSVVFSVNNSVCESVWILVKNSVNDSVIDLVCVSVEDSVSDLVSDLVRISVRASVWDPPIVSLRESK